MQVDNSLQSQFSFNSNVTFDDFFNMEMLGGSNQQSVGSTSSRDSSSSPRMNSATLPPTPPYSVDPFFNLYNDDDFIKPDTLAPPPTSHFDFFTALASDRLSSPSQSLPSGSPDEVTTPSSILSIDPLLVGTPSANKSPLAAEEIEQNVSAADNTVLALSVESPAADDPTDIAPYKVGGKGKSNRKGTVQSGGVVKKSAPPKEKISTVLSIEDKELDDWRPSPEEYKKMSSKEKRQLRNKISARNFRVRRKEYITTLETDLAERDRIIDAIRTELGSTKSENHALKQEVASLKKNLLGGQNGPVLPPPAPLPPVSAAATVATRNTANPSSPLVVPNTNKDLPSSPRLASSRAGFWGGRGTSPFGTMGGFTPVHTTLIPDFSIAALAGKGLVTPPDSPPLGGNSQSLQENINPSMNADQKLVDQQPPNANLLSPTAFDSFTDQNMFTMKTMDMFRMQLWTMKAQQVSLQRQQQHNNASRPPLTGLATGLRPHYFTTADKQPLAPSSSSNSPSSLLSGKLSSGSYITPPPTPRPAQDNSLRATPQEAALASMASQTLLSKLGSAFWEAFAGQQTSSRRTVDVDKVRKVLEGKAVVRVVDVEEPAPASYMKKASSSTTIPKMNPAPPTPKLAKSSECKDKCPVTELLEEGMKSLSISKRSPL